MAYPIQFLREDGNFAIPGASTGTGTVTSVAFVAPGEFNVTGSPVTSSGTITLAKASQNANLVYAGPASGAAAVPGFRALTVADLPAGSAIAIIGDTPPASPAVGALWWNSLDGVLYLWYNDGTSQQWVPASPQSASGLVAAWHQILNLASNLGGSSGWSGYTIRHRIGQGLLGGACSQIRVSGYAQAGAVISHAYVQEAGAGQVYDFASTPVALTWGGIASHTFANNTYDVSDNTAIAISGTKDVIISFYFSSTSALYGWGDIPSGSGAYYKAGDDSATVTTGGGYSTTTGFFIPRVEVYR